MRSSGQILVSFPEFKAEEGERERERERESQEYMDINQNKMKQCTHTDMQNTHPFCQRSWIQFGAGLGRIVTEPIRHIPIRNQVVN